MKNKLEGNNNQLSNESGIKGPVNAGQPQEEKRKKNNPGVPAVQEPVPAGQGPVNAVQGPVTTNKGSTKVNAVQTTNTPAEKPANVK